MKSKILLFVFLVTFSVAGQAKNSDDKPFHIGIGLSPGIPLGDYSSYASLSLSLDLISEYAITPEISATLSAGYVNFLSKGGYGQLGVGQIPILIGGKYQFTENVFGSLQVGIAIFDQGSGFAFAPGIGYKINKSLDLMLKYQAADYVGSNISFFGIRVGLTL